MAGWMLYTLVVSALLALAARAAESLLRLHGRPTRWVWAAAMGGSLILPALTRLRPGDLLAGLLGPAGVGSPGAGDLSAVEALAAGGLEAGGAGGGGWAWLWSLPERLPWPDVLSPSGGTEALLAVGWAGTSLALGGFLVAGGLRLRRARRRWPRAEVVGMSVRVSRDLGPAVAGLLRPFIVLPVWLLARERREVRMAVAHEGEHLRARDPLLLGSGLLAVLAAPWNLPLWWQLRRLRLAVEVDCDRRVLDRGVTVREYGDLLLSVGSGRDGLLLSPALGRPGGHLERRIRTMTEARERRFRGLRSTGLVAAALGALALACDADPPVQPPEAETTASGAEVVPSGAPASELPPSPATGDGGVAGRARTGGRVPGASLEGDTPGSERRETSARVGSAATPEGTPLPEGAVIRPETGPTIRVGGDSGDSRVIRLRGSSALRDGAPLQGTIRVDDGARLDDSAAVGDVPDRAGTGGRIPGASLEGRREAGPGSERRETSARIVRLRGDRTLRLDESSPVSERPLVYLDGVRLEEGFRFLREGDRSGRSNDLDPDDIESIHVLKGPTATSRYGPEASAGVILIRTKGADGG